MASNQSTGESADAAPTNDEPSAKEIAEKKVRKEVPGKGETVYPLNHTVMIDDMRWRPFDSYVINHHWGPHAARLRGLRNKPITTPFSNHILWDDLLAKANSWIGELPEGSLRDWEQMQMDAIVKQPVRALFRPLMYDARLQLYSNRFYPKNPAPPRTFEVSTIQPLSHYYEIVVRSDAKSANVGFPDLMPLCGKGEQLTDSQEYQKICEDAGVWKDAVLEMKKMTPTLVIGMSPPTAVFERAQSGGRAVEDVAKPVAFNGMLYTQPLYRLFESEVPEYMYGDREIRLSKMLSLLDGDLDLVADGDDLAVHLKDGTYFMVDASAFESSVSTSEVEDWISFAEDTVTTQDSREKELYRASLYGGCTEMVCNVGMVSNVEEPIRGVRSGDPGTHIRDSYHEILRAKDSALDDKQSFLKDISRFGIYKSEAQWSDSIVIGQLMVSTSDRKSIHGSMVRCLNSLWQRESVILNKRLPEGLADLEEDRRVVQVLSNLYGHPQFEQVCNWVKTLWQIRHDREAVAQAAFETAVDEKNRSGAVELSGAYERAAIQAVLEIVQ